MYLTPTNLHWACDIEADDLLEKATKIWCVCLINVVTKEKVTCLQATDFHEFQARNPEAIYVGHNFLSYDAPMLNRHWGARLSCSKIVDTFVLSQLYNPSYPKPRGMSSNKGPHSLEAWGIRLRYKKLEHEDFSVFSEDMVKYCMRDTILAGFLFIKLTERMRQVGFTEQGMKLEHEAWNIIQNKQRRNGFPFNIRKAEELYAELRQREAELGEEIHRIFPPTLVPIRRFEKARKKSGEYSKNYLRHREQYYRVVEDDDGGYTVFDYVSFNIGSPPQRIDKLLALGWEPVLKTKAGNPKVDEEALYDFAEFSGIPEIKAIAKWLVCNSRANMLRNWMDAYNPDTGCLHGQLFINSTLRYKHNKPNSANIPAVKTKKDDTGKDQVLYGEAGTWAYECRDLYTCGDPDEFVLVGVDGKGIQLRVLANYAYSEEFKARVLDGDPHTNNIKLLGLANKPAAKKFLYTTLMGGGGAKLAADQAAFGTKLTAAEGNALKRRLIDSVPLFSDLIKSLQADLETTGRITLCDGTPILVSSPHMVIPYLLQGDESRLMKQALVFLDQEIKKHRLTKDVFKVADIHDEWQWKVRKNVVELFIDLALSVFPRAGDTFGYKIPIEGDAKVGLTWAETH